MQANQSEHIACLEAQGWTIDQECETRQAALRHNGMMPCGAPVYMKSPDGLLWTVGGGMVTRVRD